MRFPELYRRLSADGAEILVMPAAFTVPTGRAHWEMLLRARAVENLCYVVAAAQSGVHPSGRETYGDSLIVDFWGRVLTRLPRGTGFVSAPIDREALKRVRAEFPALKNRVLTAGQDTHGRRTQRTRPVRRRPAQILTPPGSTSPRSSGSVLEHACPRA